MKKKEKASLTKRVIPSSQVLDWRRQYLVKVQDRSFLGDFSDAPLLEPGNSKLGQFSDRYDRVLVWNLPVVITCPGASSWCLGCCYNADPRDDKFPIEDWAKNLAFYRKDKDGLKEILLKTLRTTDTRQAVRLHSSGDFFEASYVKFWVDIMASTPAVRYWAYTRSWVNAELLQALEESRELSNFQLFASWDSSMPAPPAHWRKSIVYGGNEVLMQRGLICPEQSGMSPNCATCNYCIAKGHGDVHFILH